MKRIITIIALAMTFTGANAQLLNTIDTFEGVALGQKVSEYTWAGVTLDAEIAVNPVTDGINSSSQALKGSPKADKSNPIIMLYGDKQPDVTETFDFSVKKFLRFKLYRPIADGQTVGEINVLFTVDNVNASKLEVNITLTPSHATEWVEHVIDLTDQLVGNEAVVYNKLRLRCGPGTVAEGMGDYYFDDIELITDPSLSAKSTVLSDLKVSPTSVVDFVNFTSTSKINKVEVYSYTGQLVTEFKGKDIKSISMSGVKSGLYILNINSDLGVKAVKVIKK